MADALDHRLELVDVVAGVVAFAYYAAQFLASIVGEILGYSSLHMQMRLSSRLCISDPLLHNRFRLFHILPMQVNRIAVHLSHCIVLPEDIFGSLFVVFIRFGSMLLSLFRKLVRSTAIAAFIGLTRFSSAVLVFPVLLAGEVA